MRYLIFRSPPHRENVLANFRLGALSVSSDPESFAATCKALKNRTECCCCCCRRRLRGFENGFDGGKDLSDVTDLRGWSVEFASFNSVIAFYNVVLCSKPYSKPNGLTTVEGQMLLSLWLDKFLRTS